MPYMMKRPRLGMAVTHLLLLLLVKLVLARPPTTCLPLLAALLTWQRLRLGAGPAARVPPFLWDMRGTLLGYPRRQCAFGASDCL